MATKREIRHVLTLDGERQYTAAMQSVATALKGTKSEQALLDAEFGKGNKSIERMTKQHALLGKRLEEQRKALKLITDAYEKSRQKTGENSEVTQSLARDMNYAEAAVKNTEREIADLGVAMAKSTSRVEQFKAAMREMGITAESIGRGVESLGRTMTRYISTSVAAGLTASTKLAMDYGDALAKLGTLSDAAAYGVDQLGEQAMAASNRTGMAITDMIEAVYNTISSGVSAGDAVSLVEQAAMAAAAGGANLDDVIRGMTSTINGWKMSAGDATSVLDRFLLAAEAGTVEIGDLASNIGTVTGLAPQLNVSLDEILAAVESLSLGGVEAGSAFTGLRAIMSAVLKPSSEAADEAARLGLSFDVAALKAKGLTGFLADVQEKTQGDEESLAKLFGRVEGLSAVMALGTTAAEDYAGVLQTLGGSAGTLNEKFGIRMASDTMKLKASLNELRNAAISLGEQVTPYIEMFTTKLSGLAQYLSQMTDEERQQAVQIALIVAAAGPLLTIVGKLIQNGKQIGTMVKGLSKLVGGGGTLAAITLALGAIALVIAKIRGEWEKAREKQRMTFNLGVDTSALEKIDIDTSTINVAVQNVAIASSGKSLYDEIVAWLTDGLPETDEEVAAMTKGVTDVIGSCYDNIQNEYNTKKAALDAQFAAGLIDEATYTTELGNLQTKTTELTTSLDESAAAVTEYIATLVAANAKPTEAQLAYLQSLIDKLVETGQAANEATNAVMAGYEFAYNRANAGQATTPEEYVQAGQYIEINRTNKVTALEGQKAALQADYGTRVSGVAPGSAEFAAQSEAYSAELDAINAKIQETNEAANEMWASLAKPLLEEDGLTPEMLVAYTEAKEYLENTKPPSLESGDLEAWTEAGKTVNEVEAALQGLDTETLAALTSAMASLGLPIDSTDATTVLEDLGRLLTEWGVVSKALDDGMGVATENAADTGAAIPTETAAGMQSAQREIDDAANRAGAAIPTEMVEGVHSTQDALGWAMDEAVTHAAGGGEFGGAANNAGAAIPAEMANGLTSTQEILGWAMEGAVKHAAGGGGFGDAAAEAGETIIDRMQGGAGTRRNMLKRAMRQTGQESIQGLIDGAGDREAALVAKYAALGAAAAGAMRDALQIKSPSRVFQEIGEQTIMGFIQGTNARARQANRTVAEIINPRKVMQDQAMKTALAATAAPQSTYNNTIYYTGGITARDAKRMTAVIESQQRRKARGQGAG